MSRSNRSGSIFRYRAVRTSVAMVCTLLLPVATSSALAASYPILPRPGLQQPVVSPDSAGPALLTQQQLENLVAPIALYPDPLLGELLVASTYPLEVVEAQQFLGQNRNLRGQALVQAAGQQNWDPSVQVLVGFPDTLALLNSDIRWTTDLGNAFLAQQADVMNAIQTLRLEARSNGRLATTPQDVVTTDVQNGQSAVRIEPANPQVIYPPVYNPVYVWGPPAYGVYPAISYPAYYGGGYGGYGGGYGFGSGINIAGLFSGLLNLASWGWSIGWFTHSLSLVGLFFNALGSLFGSHGSGGSGVYASAGFRAGAPALAAWSHNPAHRLGVPYPRGFVAPRGAAALGTARSAAALATPRSVSPRLVASVSPASASRVLTASSNRPAADSWQRFGSPTPQGYRAASSAQQSYRAAPQSQTSFAEPRAAQAAPRYSASNYSAPKYSAPKVSAPKYSAPKYSAPKFSAPKAPKNSGGGHAPKISHKH